MTTTPTKPETRWWHTADNGKVVCTLCPRECHIPEGSRGFCFVRANVEGRLELTTYGRSSGFCIDPIEKKPLNHFLPGTPVLSLGTAGCNLGCKFCQNWDISKSREMDTVASYAGPEDIVRAAKETGCRSIAFTYNDPTIWAEYAIDIAKVARAEGIKTVAVTAGYITPDARREFYKWIDAANVDLKAFTESFYRRLTQTQLAPVLDTLKYLKHETDVWFEITNLVIPGENDSPDETREMCDWLVEHLGPDVPIHFSAFHPDFKMKDTPRTPHETLIRARQIALDAGLHYAYVGNVYDVHRESTYCHNCGQTLIERDWYELGRYRMNGNRCSACNTVIPGVFDDQPGDWGRKRQPVRIASAAPAGEQTTELNVSASAPKKTKKAAAQTEASTPAPKIDFTDDQCSQMIAYARSVLRDSVTGEGGVAPLPDEIANAPAYGMFVTLKRGGALRACRGRWGDARNGQVGALLSEVTRDTACNDVRFPSITPGELDLLELEVSLMHSPGTLECDAEKRAEQVEVGRHGLVLVHPQGRGLLLPQVPVENEWDAATFLQQLGRKAGLPANAAYDPQAQLLTFEARVLHDRAGSKELTAKDISIFDFEALGKFVAALLNSDDAAPSAAKLGASLTQPRQQVIGVQLASSSGLTGIGLGSGKSVADMAETAAASLRDIIAKRQAEQGSAADDALRSIAVLHQPIFLKPGEFPRRTTLLAGHALAVKSPDGFALSLPDNSPAHERLANCLSRANTSAQAWADDPAGHKVLAQTVTMFRLPEPAAASGGIPSRAAHRAPNSNTTGSNDVRPAARAGQFYPGSPEAIAAEVDAHMASGRDKQPNAKPAKHRAIMLPHAGWRFCGDVIGQVLAHVNVPERVIILGPRHTPHGPPLSVAPHRAWQLPSGDVPIDADMRSRLVELLPSLHAEPDAHRMEHGSEVLLPFLKAKNPDLRVTPIVVGQLNYDDTAALAEAVAAAVEETGENVLLVISSDMNHFAPEDVGRKLDAMALEAMQSGDPQALYRTCREHQISMCGVLPAVTIMQALQKYTPDLDINLVAYTTSAEASGDSSSVVGYAGALLD